VIQLPRRAVTRFFVPLIDVLILLFCMFLLLPFVSRTEDAPLSPDTPTDPATLQKRLKETEDRLKIKDEEVRRLMAERAKAGERTAVRVLEIDGDSGELSYFSGDGPAGERVKLANAAQAQLFIDRTKQTATGGKQAYFLILYPRKRSAYPTQPQLNTYADWFKDVPHQFDNPFAANRGKVPCSANCYSPRLACTSWSPPRGWCRPGSSATAGSWNC
jgi:hypothetical protein